MVAQVIPQRSGSLNLGLLRILRRHLDMRTQRSEFRGEFWLTSLLRHPRQLIRQPRQHTRTRFSIQSARKRRQQRLDQQHLAARRVRGQQTVVHQLPQRQRQCFAVPVRQFQQQFRRYRAVRRKIPARAEQLTRQRVVHLIPTQAERRRHVGIMFRRADLLGLCRPFAH